MHNILAGVANMGINFQCSILHRRQWSHKNLWDFSTSIACWALLHLGTSSEWKRKVIDECKALIDQYTNMTSSDPLHMAWEDKLLSLDLIIHETLRISRSIMAFRRNIEKDTRVGGVTIKWGDFVISMADVNLNPDIFTSLMMFDPNRYGSGREEDQKETHSYLSWGAGMYTITTLLIPLMFCILGRHICPGMRIVKLEMRLVLAMILISYSLQVCARRQQR